MIVLEKYFFFHRYKNLDPWSNAAALSSGHETAKLSQQGESKSFQIKRRGKYLKFTINWYEVKSIKYLN
jgi:hypothetical protein